MADGFFVAGQRDDVLHDAARSQLQRSGARVVPQQLAGGGFEVGDAALALAHQGGQGVGGGKGVFDVALD